MIPAYFCIFACNTTIGIPGAGNNAGTSGSAGGNTSFGSLLTAFGGYGGGGGGNNGFWMSYSSPVVRLLVEASYYVNLIYCTFTLASVLYSMFQSLSFGGGGGPMNPSAMFSVAGSSGTIGSDCIVREA